MCLGVGVGVGAGVGVGEWMCVCVGGLLFCNYFAINFLKTPNISC